MRAGTMTGERGVIGVDAVKCYLIRHEQLLQ